MELFEQIRRGHSAGETILQLSKKHGVHRRMVRQAIASAMPAEKKKPHDRPRMARGQSGSVFLSLHNFSFTTPRQLIPPLTRPQGPPHAETRQADAFTLAVLYTRVMPIWPLP